MRDLIDGGPIGILRGPSSRGSAMDIVAPYLPEPPARGDFALVLSKDETRALVLRIAAAHPTGSFSESSERGADYLSGLAKSEGRAEVPDRVRELLLRFRIEAVPLGRLTRVDGRFLFEAGVREIQLFGQPVYRASVGALRTLVNVGLEHEPEDQKVRIGVLARGHERVDEVPVSFSIRRLKGRRSFVFARAGYGKSNLVKLLLSRLYQAKPDVGLLIVDPEGEYAFPQKSETGAAVPGLVDHEHLRDRVTVYTERSRGQFPEDVAARIGGRIRLDMTTLTPDEFLTSFVSEEKQAQVWSNRIRSARGDGFGALIRLFREKGYHATDTDIGNVLGFRAQQKQGEGGDVSVNAIRNNVLPVIKRLDCPGNDLLTGTVDRLMHAKVVVLDVSAMGGADADAIVRVVLQRIFRKRVESFTEGDAEAGCGVLLVLEEAQAVLGHRAMDDHDIYVRWVKEGRKYKLGAMLITQQPGAISPHLVSQGDNFFAMHLLAQRDLDVLGAANAHYTPEILEFLRSEPVKGNCYFWSAPDQPYVVPCRVANYDDETRRGGAELSAPRAEIVAERPPPAEPSYEEQLDRSVLAALCGGGRVRLYRVASVDGAPAEDMCAAARSYLASSLPDADALNALRPADWERRWDRTTIRSAPLLVSLHRLGVLQGDGTGHGDVGGKDRPVVVLSGGRLRAAARAIGLASPTVRESAVDLVTGG